MNDDIELLKKARKMLGLNQEKLAALLGVNKISVCRWETGARTPGSEVFKTLLRMIIEREDSVSNRLNFINATAKKLTPGTATKK